MAAFIRAKEERDMTAQYRKWPDLTPQQQQQALTIGAFVGYSTNELPSLLYGVEDGLVISLRDNDFIYANIIPQRPRALCIGQIVKREAVGKGIKP